MRGISFVLAMVVALVVAPACWAEILVPMIQFGAETDFSDNFTVTSGGQYDPTDDAGYGVGGCVTLSKSGHNSMVYDVDKAIGGAGEVFGQATIDVDFKAGDGGAIGIWALKHPTKADRTYKSWTFFRPNAIGSDTVDYYTARNMTTDSPSSYKRRSYSADTTLAPGSWMHLRFDINVDDIAGSATLTLSVYDSQTLFDATTLKFQDSYTHVNATTTTGEVGVEVYHAAQFDNFAVYSLGGGPTVIPEPGTLALLATGLLGLLCYAWRKRK